MVRDSAAWLLGHVFDLVSNVVDASNLNPILEALHGSLDDEPRVAKNACWVWILTHALSPTISSLQSLNSLIEVLYEDAANANPEGDVPVTYALSPAFSTIVGKLLQIANRYAIITNQCTYDTFCP